jgi:glycosyltransferase involved in cell wall biosynthesis
MKLSVVMAVYNGAERLPATLDSIALQTERDYELIVIDDGSTDESPAILREYAARDERIRVVTQENAGLTRSLIRGCQWAMADVIARHDCGDISQPGRFARQLVLLDAHPEVVLVSCGARFRAPGGELLYEVHADGEKLREGLLHGDAATVRGLPHHGTAMFRAAAYEAAGGYRAEFRYAQDLDLWTRMATQGSIAAVPEIFYEATVDTGTLSANAREQQVELTTIAVQLRDATTESDTAALLARAACVVRTAPRTRRDDARALYFLASCLQRNRHTAWPSYARAAIRENPLHYRAWLLFLRALLPQRWRAAT